MREKRRGLVGCCQFYNVRSTAMENEGRARCYGRAQIAPTVIVFKAACLREGEGEEYVNGHSTRRRKCRHLGDVRNAALSNSM